MSYNCDLCGRFIGWDTCDEWTEFGSAADLEPPDPVIVCRFCAKSEEDRIVEKTHKPARPHIPWRLAKFHRRAVLRLGMVLAGPKMAAWCEAFWPDQVPDDYELRM
jgi:hypothetical protein